MTNFKISTVDCNVLIELDFFSTEQAHMSYALTIQNTERGVVEQGQKNNSIELSVV